MVRLILCLKTMVREMKGRVGTQESQVMECGLKKMELEKESKEENYSSQDAK